MCNDSIPRGYSKVKSGRKAITSYSSYLSCRPSPIVISCHLPLSINFSLLTTDLTFVPDEEIGGLEGMCWFISLPEFTKMNVGLCLDEGLASPSENFTVFYGERAPMWVNIKGREKRKR